MKRYGGKRRVGAIAALALAAVLSGCAYHADLTRSAPLLPDAAILDRLPLKAALYLPPSTRNFDQPTDVSRGCLAMHVRGPFGRIFAGTVEGTLGQVFETLVVVPRPAAGDGDLLVEAALTAYVYKAGCMGNPGSYGIVEGWIRAVDPGGRELWRSRETEKRSAFTGHWEDFVPESMAALVGLWAQELTGDPQIRALRPRKR